MNQGCFTYVRPRIESLMKYTGLTKRAHVHYVGRNPSSAPATGHHDAHDRELEKFLTEAFL